LLNALKRPVDIEDTMPSLPKRKKNTRFRWTPENVQSLITFLCDSKSEYEYKGLDFEADLATLYKEIRLRMADIYDNFGPATITEIDENISGKELANQKLIIAAENKAIKIGYDRIREKVKDIRQNYRKAVTKGRRSGSGKLVFEHYDQLKV